MKTDYTITPEYYNEKLENWERSYDATLKSIDFSEPDFHVNQELHEFYRLSTGQMIQPEYRGAQQLINEFYGHLGTGLQNYVGRETPEQLARMQRGMMNINPCSGQMSAPVSQEAGEWINAYDEARLSNEAREPLIRTVCKIAARILFVLLLVGVGAGVLLK